jgi:transcriptional regulator with XRE-family HTH domain
VPDPKNREPIITEALIQLKTWLENQPRSRAEIAREFDVSGAALSSWLAGFSRPKAHIRERVCWVTGIDPELWSTELERAVARGEASARKERGAA